MQSTTTNMYDRQQRGSRSRRERTEEIFLFVPNLIGYGRIVLAVVAFYYMPYNVYIATTSYLASELLDAFDGYSARKLNQSTTFGAVLDMVTDRCTTLCLLMYLGLVYPVYLLVFQLLAALDIFSHWIAMYSSLLAGSTHKKVTNPVLKLYYSKIILFTCCAGNELFFISLYLLSESVGPITTINGYQWGWFEILAILTFPISLFKNLVNVLQMVYAAKNIAAYDVALRAKSKDSG